MNIYLLHFFYIPIAYFNQYELVFMLYIVCFSCQLIQCLIFSDCLSVKQVVWILFIRAECRVMYLLLLETTMYFFYW